MTNSIREKTRVYALEDLVVLRVQKQEEQHPQQGEEDQDGEDG